MTTYSILIDTARNGTFSTDVSADCKSIQIQLGLKEPHSNMARVAELELVLNNPDGRYSPGHASALAGFEIGTAIRIQMTYDGTTVNRFTGWIDPPEVTAGTRGKRETTINAQGYLSRIQYPDALVVYDTNVWSGEAIQVLMDGAAVYPPGFNSWRLGRPSYSELGTTTRLAGGVSDYASLDGGSLLISYLGDSFKGSVYDAIRDVVTTDGGWFYVDGDGLAHFRENHYRYEDLATAVDATLDNTMLIDPEPVYVYGERLVNRVLLHYNPRNVDTDYSVVGSLPGEQIEIEAGQSVDVIIPFHNTDGDTIAAYDVITPLKDTDWDAESEQERWKQSTLYHDAGVDFSVTNTDVKANRITVTFTRAADPVYPWTSYVQNIQVRGKAINDLGRGQVVDEDTTSQSAYGIWERRFNFSLMDSDSYAREWAKNCVGDLKTPVGHLTEISIRPLPSSATMMALVRDVEIGDRWKLSEDQTGVDEEEYYVVGIREIIHPGGDHVLTAILEPIPSPRWLLGTAGFSELGSTTWLGLGQLAA